MLKIYTLTLGSYQTNCYIIHDEASKTCCVIDPGYTPDVIWHVAVHGVAKSQTQLSD